MVNFSETAASAVFESLATDTVNREGAEVVAWEDVPDATNKYIGVSNGLCCQFFPFDFFF